MKTIQTSMSSRGGLVITFMYRGGMYLLIHAFQWVFR